MGKEIEQILWEKDFPVVYPVLPTIIYLFIASYCICYVLADLPYKTVNDLSLEETGSTCYEIN